MLIRHHEVGHVKEFVDWDGLVMLGRNVISYLVMVEISCMSTLNSLFLLKGNFVRGNTVNFDSCWVFVFYVLPFPYLIFLFAGRHTHKTKIGKNMAN